VKEPSQFHYLRQSGVFEIGGVDDGEDFAALTAVGWLISFDIH